MPSCRLLLWLTATCSGAVVGTGASLPTVQVYLTTTDQVNLFAQQEPVEISPLAPAPRPLPTISINTKQTYQRM
jgi:hypothetical protein